MLAHSPGIFFSVAAISRRRNGAHFAAATAILPLIGSIARANSSCTSWGVSFWSTATMTMGPSAVWEGALRMTYSVPGTVWTTPTRLPGTPDAHRTPAPVRTHYPAGFWAARQRLILFVVLTGS